jgi:DNA polymerase-3 subunit delta
MSTAALRTLRDALKEGSFSGVYYICGEDDFQKEDAMKQLIAAAVDPTTRDFNLDVRRGQEVDARTLDSLLSAVPMMADRRVVVIRDAGSLKKDTRVVLERFLKNPPPDLMLLLVEAAGGKTDKDLCRMATVMEFEPLSADRIPKWISHYTSTNLGTRITSGAAELLHAAIGSNLHDLVSELDKLASYWGESRGDNRGSARCRSASEYASSITADSTCSRAAEDNSRDCGAFIDVSDDCASMGSRTNQ